MNVWILNHYAVPPDTPGGTRHFDFAKELVKRGQRVSIFAAGFNHRTRIEERLGKKQNYRRQNVDEVEFIWIKTFPYQRNDWRRAVNMLSYSLRVIFLGLRLKKRPDVILASSPHLFTGLAGWLLAKLRRSRFILEVRDLWPQTFVDIGCYNNKSLVVRLLRFLERFLYHRAKKIIVLPPRASEYITRLGTPINKIVPIPNGVSPELFSNTEVQLPPELEELILGLKARGKILVGHTGAHGIADVLDTIIDTAKVIESRGMDKIHFLLVGGGAEKDRLMRKVESLGLSNVSFSKPIPKYAIPTLLRNVEIAVLPNAKSDLYEYGISSNRLLDYMACARPIVLAINSNDNPVAEAHCGVIVLPEDAEQMAKAVIELCGMSDKQRREMGMRGYEYAMKYHSVPVLVDRLLEVMEDVKAD
jgi:glycosyltransferase involved in cell wall biosynthesis